jgi:hypothetical protein
MSRAVPLGWETRTAWEALQIVTMLPWARWAMNRWAAGGMFLSPVGIRK